MADVANRTTSKVWNSLEVCKLAATTLVAPAIVGVLAFLIWNAQQEVIRHWERNQAEQRRLTEADLKEHDKLREFRLSIYRDAAPLLNDIISYHFYVGRWKERSPADIIEKKRQLDSILYPHRALFTPRFFALYHTFMSQGFRTAGNHYGESRLRTQSQCRNPRSTDDTKRWAASFTSEDTRRGLCAAYTMLLSRVAEELLFKSLVLPGQSNESDLSLCPPFYDVERC